MQKRLFLKVGLLGTAALAAGGAYYALTIDPKAGRKTVLTALVPAMLGNALPTDAKRDAALQTTIAAVETAIEGLSPSAQSEIAQLFGLLASPIGPRLAGVSSWQTATPEALVQGLQSWRTHNLDLLQVAYHALHDLILGSWYANPSTWAAIQYNGPLSL